MLTLARPRVELLHAPGSDALDLGNVMDAEARAFIQGPRVSQHVAAARFIDMQTDRLSANWALRGERMPAPPAQQLQELTGPYREKAHLQSPAKDRKMQSFLVFILAYQHPPCG